MKKGATPQLTYAWWDKNKAKTLGKTGLGAALKAYETASKKVTDKCHINVLQEARDKLFVVNETAAKAVKKCNKVTHKETMEALKKYDAVVKTAAKPLVDAILEAEKVLLTLAQLKKEYRPKCEKAWREFDALNKGVQEALKQAEAKNGTAKDVQRWIKLADSAEDLAKQKLEECKEGQSKVNALVTSASKHVKFGHGDTVMEVMASLGKLIVQIDGQMGDVKSNAKKLKAAAEQPQDASNASEPAQTRLKDLTFKSRGTQLATAKSAQWVGKELVARMEWTGRLDPLSLLQQQVDVASKDGQFDQKLKFKGWIFGNAKNSGTGKFVA